MATLSKASFCFTIGLVILIAIEVIAQTPITEPSQSTQTHIQPIVNNQIVLDAAEQQAFNCYNTNGTAPYINGNSALFYGANTTNTYSDIVSQTTVKTDKTLMLEAQITANVTCFSDNGEDQFAVFATDDITNYKSDEFGFAMPETGNVWYAYIQSPKILGFFAWQPLNIPDPLEPHNFQAVYSSRGLWHMVDFFVDGKLLWSTSYPDVSGKEFHMVLTSHKVSADRFDLSLNQIEVKNALLSDKME
jgi:hypothetical protein